MYKRNYRKYLRNPWSSCGYFVMITHRTKWSLNTVHNFPLVWHSTSCAGSHFESFEPYIQKIRFLHALPNDGNLKKFTRIRVLAHDLRCDRVSIYSRSFFAYCWNFFGPFYWLPTWSTKAFKSLACICCLRIDATSVIRLVEVDHSLIRLSRHRHSPPEASLSTVVVTDEPLSLCTFIVTVILLCCYIPASSVFQLVRVI